MTTIVEKTWTAEQAWAAQVEAMANGLEVSDPSGPYYRWDALHVVDNLKGRFETGDRRALLAAIRECANHDLPMPDWVAAAFIRAYDNVHQMRLGSWDDAFGRPYPKGFHLAKARRRQQIGPAVWMAVKVIRDEEPETPIDEGLFERVGAKLGIGKTLANELYYRWKPRLELSRNS
jgi:hypothetical protein